MQTEHKAVLDVCGYLETRDFEVTYSACTAASIDPSHVLLAMNLTETAAFSCLRFSLGRFTTDVDIDSAIDRVKSVVEELRALVG